MKPAPTFLSALVLFVVPILSRHGIIVDTESLNTTLTTLVTVILPLFIMLRQWWIGRSTPVGTKP